MGLKDKNVQICRVTGVYTPTRVRVRRWLKRKLEKCDRRRVRYGVPIEGRLSIDPRCISLPAIGSDTDGEALITGRKVSLAGCVWTFERVLPHSLDPSPLRGRALSCDAEEIRDHLSFRRGTQLVPNALKPVRRRSGF
jgi:hypothetical protein